MMVWCLDDGPGGCRMSHHGAERLRSSTCHELMTRQLYTWLCGMLVWRLRAGTVATCLPEIMA